MVGLIWSNEFGVLVFVNFLYLGLVVWVVGILIGFFLVFWVGVVGWFDFCWIWVLGNLDLEIGRLFCGFSLFFGGFVLVDVLWW